jgi:adenosylcobinamide kinase/adenosylcobinamide-phosphate guanylyltransferase
LAAALGGEEVLYVATALVGEDRDLERRVLLHRERRPLGWGTLEIGGGDLGAVLEAAEQWRAVLLDSLTLWVSARMSGEEGTEGTLEALDLFLEGAMTLATPFIFVSDEVGLGVVPGSGAGRKFRDTLGLVNQRAAAVAEEVHLCVAGITTRIK